MQESINVRRKQHEGSVAPFRHVPLAGLLLGLLLLLIVFLCALCLGSVLIDLPTALRALFAFDGSTAHDIVRNLRLPRVLTAMCVGGSLAVAGALMQVVTKNPLASPSLMGVSAGASFLVVATTLFFGITSLSSYVWLSLIGAAVSGALVYALGSLGRQGMTPLKLVIAGSTVLALFSSLTQGLLVIRESTLDDVRFWLAGSLSGRNITLLLQVLPYLGVGIVLALLFSRQITTLSLGDDVARGLGQRVGWIKAIASLAIILLAGAAVAIAGPIGFVGLVIPHLTRALVGNDYRWILPYCLVFGAVLLLGADVISRVVARPGEVPVGAITALVGAPVLIWLVRKKVRRG